MTQRRLRHVQFGSNDGGQLLIDRPSCLALAGYEPTVMANDSRPISELARLQGLPDGFDIPAFMRSELARAIGNGVPYPMARVLAEAVKCRRDWGRLCACQCGRRVIGRQVMATNACRKRVYDRKNVTDQVIVVAGG
jgi:DNA (cytosine-5)-methyltransferase 1